MPLRFVKWSLETIKNGAYLKSLTSRVCFNYLFMKNVVMKFKTKFILTLITVLGLTLSSCVVRLVDFTVISSKNVSLPFDRGQGRRVKASRTYFLGIGWEYRGCYGGCIRTSW